ncbi:MAG TPA: cytochrome c biogenesis protein CcsA [Bryobacteraceae bacterium]|jgi:heme exporter protein C|nr:cytochrome c biogenesis protein CcsA [Bryobacteraceae bacterium]
MREKIILVLATICAVILSLDLYKILLVLPNEKDQGAIYRIIYFHVPSIITGFTGFFVALVASGMYLATRNLKYDAFAAAVTEVSLAFATVVLATGSIWGRIIWGIWWTWDARLTSMLVCWLIYAGYMMLRRAIEEPTERARLSAIVSIFGCVDIFIVWKSIEWFRTQHPGPVLSVRDGGGMAPGMEGPIYWNWVALMCLAAILVMVRMRQEDMSRQIDSLRRMAHTY